MSGDKPQPEASASPALDLVHLAEAALGARSLEELGDRTLPNLQQIAGASGAFLALVDSRLSERRFLAHQLAPDAASDVEARCARQFGRVLEQTRLGPVPLAASDEQRPGVEAVVYPLRKVETCVGLAGLVAQPDVAPAEPDWWPRALGILAAAADRLIDRVQAERQLAHLNAYLSVSAMLAQYLGLQESLEIALYCCMEVVSAEAASVLLLDDEKENFRFYQIEGPAKPVLAGATFPADKGIAGDVLRSQRSEVINDVAGDPRFYGKIDTESGFKTRNMIVMPLSAGEEEIGVLEILNKADGTDFSEDERLLVLSIAEEIAFAIRNAKVFEYVVNSYCKQRQGQSSCRGCKRPLGSWTPCVKYRETVA
jgi:GAF domain-containing protein